MAFNDKITKVTGIITSIKTKIDELKETYFSKIEELNEKLQGLQDAMNENAEEAKGKAKKSMQYINTQIKKIQKEYDSVKFKNIKDKLKDIVEFSTDAGKFVCNNLYYHLLAYNPYKTLFIHIPNCLDDDNNYIKYARVIENIIDKLK